MNLQASVLQLSDIDEVINFEQNKMVEMYPDESDRMIASWSSRARKESFEHYLPLGWSFVVRDRDQSQLHQDGLMTGYFIAQPLLFLDGQTQSLWVEHMQFSNLQSRDFLCELAYRLSREKHLQRVYFPQQQSIQNSVANYGALSWQPQTIIVKTTKSN